MEERISPPEGVFMNPGESPRGVFNSRGEWPLCEDRAFADLVSIKLSKLADGDEKEELKLQILHSLVTAQRHQRMKNNGL